MKKNPLVSIIIPVYNGANFVKEAIDSALAQTYKNIEIIVVNDGSNDNGRTEQIIKSFGNKVTYYKKNNGGVSTALNLGIQMMKGEYFSWLSHDDMYFPQKIEKQVDFLKKIPKNTIVYSNYIEIDQKSKELTKYILNHELLEEKPEYSLLRGAINGNTLLIPKKAFNEIGLFNEQLRCVQDYELWQRMSKKYYFKHMTDILVKARIHKNQVTLTSPMVIFEGNKFWLDMVLNFPKERMIELEGSEYNFYKEMIKYLNSTPYREVKNFLKNKCAEIERQPDFDLKEQKKIRLKFATPHYKREVIGIPKKIVNLIRVYGINGTYKKIVKRLKDN